MLLVHVLPPQDQTLPSLSSSSLLPPYLCAVLHIASPPACLGRRFLQLHSQREREEEVVASLLFGMVRCAAMEVAEAGRPLAAAGAGGGGGGARPENEGLPCPRCESTNTKFCYYNNYNMAQPRHFCKGCRRYWTRGGALRNVPVGGGTRKAAPAGRRKRASSHAVSAPAAASAHAPAPLSVASGPATLPHYELSFVPGLPPAPLAAMDPDRQLLDLGGSFSSLLAPTPLPNAHFAAGFLLAGPGVATQLAPPAPAPAPSPVLALPPPPQPPASQAMPEGIWCMGWPDLSI